MYCNSLPLYYQLVIDSDEGEVDTGDAGAPVSSLLLCCGGRSLASQTLALPVTLVIHSTSSLWRCIRPASRSDRADYVR